MIFFIIIWAVWATSEIVINRLFRSSSYGKGSQDRGSVKFIWITLAIGNTLGILAANFSGFRISTNPFIQYAGLGLILAGMIFRFISILTLGRFFTVDVTIQRNHILKQDGFYRFIRHPSYLGMIISFIGFGFSLDNWISLFIITVPLTLAIIYRIKIEEKLLAEQFGSAYTDYMKKTYRLFPLIY